MLEHQEEMRGGMQEYKIKQANDLSLQNISSLVRRGLVHVVADMNEATTELTDETLQRLKLNMTILRPFRNVAIHQYGQVDNVMLYAVIQHCISKEVTDSIKATLSTLL